MTRWTITHGDILDRQAEVLICSANVFLTLSGGVGGALLQRYGDALQHELNQHLKSRSIRHVAQGEVVRTSSGGAPYLAILHAVTVDGMYRSSPDVVVSVVRRSLAVASVEGAKTVALAALATGYGRLPIRDFAEALLPLVGQPHGNIEEICVCLRHPDQADVVQSVLQQNGSERSKP